MGLLHIKPTLPTSQELLKRNKVKAQTFPKSRVPAYSGANSPVLDCVECLVPVTAKVWVRSQARPFRICGKLSGNGTSFSLSTSVFLPIPPVGMVHQCPVLIN